MACIHFRKNGREFFTTVLLRISSGASSITQQPNCGISSSVLTLACQPIRYGAVIQPASLETSLPRAMVSSTWFCSKGNFFVILLFLRILRHDFFSGGKRNELVKWMAETTNQNTKRLKILRAVWLRLSIGSFKSPTISWVFSAAHSAQVCLLDLSPSILERDDKGCGIIRGVGSALFFF